MKETNLADYESSKYAKSLLLAEPKEGKSCFAIAQCLGVWPGQKEGGVVDDPSNLHVLTFDAGALSGVKRFLLETCKAPEPATKFRIYNLQDDLRQASTTKGDWDFTFYNAIVSAMSKVQARAKGRPVMLMSSLTGLYQGLLRSLSGPPGNKKGNGMDMAKWSTLGQHAAEIRNLGQTDEVHCFWEAHVMKQGGKGGQGGDSAPTETMAIQGQTGQNFAYNVEQVFRLRRLNGAKLGNTNCDDSYLDCRPSMEIIANGRNFTEALKPQERDLTVALRKLGLKVGHWGQKSAAVKPLKKAV